MGASTVLERRNRRTNYSILEQIFPVMLIFIGYSLANGMQALRENDLNDELAMIQQRLSSSGYNKLDKDQRSSKINASSDLILEKRGN